MPTSDEKKQMIESFRPRFIHMVNPNKDSWNELTRNEKKELNIICERHFSMLQF